MFFVLAMATAARAEQQPVFGQIDAPHPYSHRERYLPQLTAGRRALTSLPGSGELNFALHGSLWRQSLGSGESQRPTAGPDYDDQPDASPDASPDGRWVLPTSYHDAAVALDLASRRRETLPRKRAVKVEPRVCRLDRAHDRDLCGLP